MIFSRWEKFLRNTFWINEEIIWVNLDGYFLQYTMNFDEKINIFVF